jgi:hypothetical protein
MRTKFFRRLRGKDRRPRPSRWIKIGSLISHAAALTLGALLTSLVFPVVIADVDHQRKLNDLRREQGVQVSKHDADVNALVNSVESDVATISHYRRTLGGSKDEAVNARVKERFRLGMADLDQRAWFGLGQIVSNARSSESITIEQFKRLNDLVDQWKKSVSRSQRSLYDLRNAVLDGTPPSKDDVDNFNKEFAKECRKRTALAAEMRFIIESNVKEGVGNEVVGVFDRMRHGS